MAEVPANLKPYLFKPGHTGVGPVGRRPAAPKLRFRACIDRLLAERIPVSIGDGRTIRVKREKLLALRVLELAMDQHPERSAMPLHVAALNHILDRYDPLETVQGGAAGGVIVNVNTGQQMLFAQQVQEVAGQGPVGPATVLEAIERMPDDEGDASGNGKAQSP